MKEQNQNLEIYMKKEFGLGIVNLSIYTENFKVFKIPEDLEKIKEYIHSNNFEYLKGKQVGDIWCVKGV